jgi:hypothetical protein
MPDASQQDALTKELSGAPNQNLSAPGRTRLILPALSVFILKNDQMPLLKRINSASRVALCQEKMRDKNDLWGETSRAGGHYFTLRVDSRTINWGTSLR